MFKALVVPAFLLSSITSYAQTAVKADDVGAALPKEILESIKGAASSKTLYPVDGHENFSGQILKADEIIFGPGARLTLNANFPWIAIVAKKWKFADPVQWTRIERDPTIFLPKAAVGADGVNGADRPGETNRRGNDGSAGADGHTGSTGASRNVPHIYIIAGDVTTPDGQPLPGFLRLALVFPGIDGGEGGDGGRGGNGGNAGNGGEGATHLFDCGEGGGPGGTGGTAGRGGAGGTGGPAGNGSDMTIVSFAQGIEIFSYAKIVNVAGEPGSGGDPGRVGLPGAGGRGAGRNGFCGPTDSGQDGTRPIPRNLGVGQDGALGSKGSVSAITVGSLKPVFE